MVFRWLKIFVRCYANARILFTSTFGEVTTLSGSPVESLRLLMEEHNVKQSELPKIGSQGVVSEY